MNIYTTISPLILLFIHNGEALDLDAAFKNGKFEEIRGSQKNIVILIYADYF